MDTANDSAAYDLRAGVTILLLCCANIRQMLGVAFFFPAPTFWERNRPFLARLNFQVYLTYHNEWCLRLLKRLILLLDDRIIIMLLDDKDHHPAA